MRANLLQSGDTANGVNRGTEEVRLVVNYQFHRRTYAALLFVTARPSPLSARWKPKPSRYKLSFSNNLNVSAAFASADIRALTVTGAGMPRLS